MEGRPAETLLTADTIEIPQGVGGHHGRRHCPASYRYLFFVLTFTRTLLLAHDTLLPETRKVVVAETRFLKTLVPFLPTVMALPESFQVPLVTPAVCMITEADRTGFLFEVTVVVKEHDCAVRSSLLHFGSTTSLQLAAGSGVGVGVGVGSTEGVLGIVLVSIANSPVLAP